MNLSVPSKICGIYYIHCRPTDEGYVGQSEDIYKRIRYHRRNLEKGYSTCPPGEKPNYRLSKDYDYYGANNFDIYILSTCTATELDDYENYWISIKGIYNYKKPDSSADPLVVVAASKQKTILLSNLSEVPPMPWPNEKQLVSADVGMKKSEPKPKIKTTVPKPVVYNPPVVKFIVTFLLLGILIHLALVVGAPPLIAVLVGMFVFGLVMAWD